MQPIRTLSAHTSDNTETHVVVGQVMRELMRTDRYGRRYLRFTVEHPAGSICCYWFINGGSRLDGLRHGRHYRIQGEAHWTGDREVLVVRRFEAVESAIARKKRVNKREQSVTPLFRA